MRGKGQGMKEQFGFTILTEPLDIRGKLRENIKSVVGRHGKYGGHAAVTRGLIEGLNKINYENYNYRPRTTEIKEHVHILAGVKTLQYAIELKKKGRIKHLSAGPNIIVWPDEADGIVTREEVELFLLPSEWNVNNTIKRAPSLKGRCIPWPVGVDMDFFSPTTLFQGRNSQNVLIYHKDESDQFCWHVDYILRRRGYHTHILKPGAYTLAEYKKLLSQSDFMVAISRPESQGIFMPEAWSMDVPTICFDRNFYRWAGTDIEIEGEITTCPYLAKENGVRFMEIRELEDILDHWDELKKEMSPREWCQENMSDIVCAKNFVNLLGARFGK